MRSAGTRKNQKRYVWSDALSDHVMELLADLDRIGGLDVPEREAAIRRTGWLGEAAGEDIEAIVQAILARPPAWSHPQDVFLTAVFRRVLMRQHEAAETAAEPADDVTAGRAPPLLGEGCLQQAAALYRHWGPQSRARSYLLCWFTAARTSAALRTWTELMLADPPDDPDFVAAIFGPLFQHRDYDPTALFPALLDGLKHISLAAAILDLSNFLTRERLVPRHPAAGRAQELALLLAGLVGRLSHLETTPPVEGADLESASRRVKEAISLAVSLCDALALIGDKSAVGKLYQAMELSHRRLRAEAAAALAKLGEETGEQVLIGLAEEPAVRLRVLAYAEELGILDRVEAPYRTEQAKAEADLVLWLAQPSQMGVPPSRCELVDTRQQAWPGYDELVECFLFRFVYAFRDAEFSNVGIAGPLTHAFAADLADLPPDDIYAAFAGWHVQHEEIFEVPADSWSDPQRLDVVRLERRLRDAGYDAIVPERLGCFLGDRALVATAMYQGMPGVAVADQLQCAWWPRRGSSRPIDPEVAYCIYKGRKLLRTFNE